jgi:hypothetical protein
MEVVVAYLKAVSRNMPRETEDNLRMLEGIWVKIWIRNLKSMKQEC